MCSDPFTLDTAEAAFSASIPRFRTYLATGQMALQSYDQWYLDRERRFSCDRVTGMWKDQLTQALHDGYDGLRVSGNTTWIPEEIWGSFADYEAGLYGALCHDPVLVMCCYRRIGRWVPDIIDVLRSHQSALVKRKGQWVAMNFCNQLEAQWEALFNEVAEGVLVTDEQGIILAANNTALRYFGVTRIEELGANLEELAVKFSVRAQSGSARLAIPELTDLAEARTRRWCISPHDTGLTLEFLVRAREFTCGLITSKRFVVIFQDITELRKADRERDRALRVLAHELRNPLQVLKAVTSLMDASCANGPEPVSRYIGTMRGQVDRLVVLVEELLTACRAGDSTLTVAPEPAELASIVQECVDAAKASAQHEIIARFSPRLHAPVCADPVRVRQILMNLLDNAAKYTPVGKRIWVDVLSTGGRALVTVEDEGIGIPEGEADLVFQAFYRASNLSPCFSDGMGLGLFISRQLARLHGGDIWVERRLGSGTIMNFTLPLRFTATREACCAGSGYGNCC